jgi:hypothetical protein
MWKRIGDDPTHYCGMWATTPNEYLKRHDGLAKIIHQKLAEVAELIEEKIPYYKYTPANVLENDNFKLYWNRSILTDKTIPFNRPDITFISKKTKKTFLIDIAVPNTHNLAKKPINKRNTKNWRMKYVLCGSQTQLK